MNGDKEKNWWGRNWKWFVPVGCLSMMALFVGFIALIVVVVFGAMKSSDVYKDAVAIVKADETVIEALGTPIEEGLLISGNMNISGGAGNADISIPISGPKSDATIYVQAAKQSGQWEFYVLDVEVKNTGEIISLVTEE